jgi:hypothetical protein
LKIKIDQYVINQKRNYVNTVPDKILEKARTSKLAEAAKGVSVESNTAETRKKRTKENNYTEASRDYRYIYPDFLSDPVYYYRDKIKEKLERQDMINRRKQISIPEFYPGKNSLSIYANYLMVNNRLLKDRLWR